MEITKIAKGEIVQRPGAKTHQIITVSSGLLRMYHVDEAGKEHVFLFAPEGWILSDFAAINEGRPSAFFVQAIEPSEVTIFSKALHEKLPGSLHESPAQVIERMGNRIAALQRRVMLLLSCSALERYQQFLTDYPSIVRRAPQKMIASYLGITPQALSKIRGQKSGGSSIY